MTDLAISCNNVTLEYRLLTHRFSGFKEMILNPRRLLNSSKNFKALKNVSLNITKGQSVALIGHNGCGKSTLLKAIAGVITPQTGTIQVLGRIGPMIELGAGFDPELSGLENIELSCMLMGLSKGEIRQKLDSIIRFADLGDFIHAPIKNYSSGMTARIGFACATTIDPDILLVDEVLSVGDSNFALKCLGRIGELRKRGSTVVLVSHDMNAVRSFCDRAVVMEEGAVLYDGNVEEGIEFHADVMRERLTNSNPELAKLEAQRLLELRKSSESTVGPKALVVASILQHGKVSEVLDCSKPFEIQIDAIFTKNDQVSDGITFGIGFLHKGNFLTGFNNLDLNLGDPASLVRENNKIRATYIIAEGMPELAAQSEIDIICGIHDKKISREIFVGSILKMPLINSKLGSNRHTYIVDLGHRVTSFKVEIA